MIPACHDLIGNWGWSLALAMIGFAVGALVRSVFVVIANVRAARFWERGY